MEKPRSGSGKKKWAVPKESLQTMGVEGMRPTQGAVGMIEVELKMREMRSRQAKPGALEKYLRAHPIPAVRGPDGRMYLIDHHHMGLALCRLEREWDHGDGAAGGNPYRKCYFTVRRDYIDKPEMSLREFSKELEGLGLCHPFDGKGRRIERLPESLDRLEDDPYRSLAGLARKAGGFDKVDKPYLEFEWADYFRSRISKKRITWENLPSAIESALELCADAKAMGLPGSKQAAPDVEIPSLLEIKARLSKRYGSDDDAPDLPAMAKPGRLGWI